MVASSSALGAKGGGGAGELSKINHIVVIYEENHSFDNLYGGWEGVNSIGGPGYASHATQKDSAGATEGGRTRDMCTASTRSSSSSTASCKTATRSAATLAG